MFYVENSGSHGLEAKATDEGIVFGWTSTGANISWNEAISAAKAYGPGWRLPTKDELNMLYQQQAVVGGFTIMSTIGVLLLWMTIAAPC